MIRSEIAVDPDLQLARAWQDALAAS